MQSAEALDELMTLSSQVREAVILDSTGSVLAATGAAGRGDRLARGARELLAAATDVRAGEITRLEIDLGDRGVFVVVEDGRTAVATTVADATPGLVVYDLRTALRRVAEGEAQEKPRSARARTRAKKEKDGA
jgi:predicted regulator of Ras-like GTPase activity (Roadblock/LC7/MglB family)